MSFLLNPYAFGQTFAAGLAGKFFNGSWRSVISTGNIGTLPLTTTNDSSNVTGTTGLPTAAHRFGVNLWPSIAFGNAIGDNYGFIAIGYFTPPTTGTYNFWTSSDDYSGVWIGTLASDATGRTSANAVVNNGMNLGVGGQGNTKRGGSIALTGGLDYAIRIVHEEATGGDNLTFSWSGPGISETTDLTTYFKTLTVGDGLFGNFIPPPLLPQGVVPVTGAFSRYTADSFASTTWSDISGNSRHATVSRGAVSLSASSGNGSTKTFGTLQGGTGDGILFPTDVLPSTYTLFHLSRYTGSSNFRIVTGTGNNWLSGHWAGNTGVAFHEGWLTDQVNRFGNNWVLSTDQNSLYRGNRTTYGTSGGSASTRLTVNAGQTTEYSAWQVAEVIVYNRTLSLEEYTSVENFLVDKYGLS